MELLDVKYEKSMEKTINRCEESLEAYQKAGWEVVGRYKSNGEVKIWKRVMVEALVRTDTGPKVKCECHFELLEFYKREKMSRKLAEETFPKDVRRGKVIISINEKGRLVLSHPLL